MSRGANSVRFLKSHNWSTMRNNGLEGQREVGRVRWTDRQLGPVCARIGCANILISNLTGSDNYRGRSDYTKQVPQ